MSAAEEMTGGAQEVARPAAAAAKGDRVVAAALVAEQGLGALIDAGAAALLLLDIVLLGWAVTARYFLRIPVTWVEEVATTSFVWFGMLGVVGALRRGMHLRLSFVPSRLAPRARALTDAAGLVVVLVFAALLVGPALDLAEQNSFMHSPNLGIPGSVGPIGTLVSLVLMMAFLLLRLWRTLTLAGFAAAVAIAAAAFAGLNLTGPVLEPLGNLNLLVFFGGVVGVLIVAGVPIAFSFGAATLLYFVLTSDLPLSVIVGRIDEGMSSFLLLTIPLFIFLGLMIQYTGMARSMVDFVAVLFGHVRGGLGYVLLCAMYLVSGISGAKAADMAAIGPILAPAMKERGTRPGDTVALLAVSAAAAETIPPSLVLIIIGSVTGISIAALFTAGLVPALVCMVALAATCHLRSRGESRGAPVRDLRRIGRAFVAALPGLALPFLIRAAVLKGVATATEVAVVGIAYTAAVGVYTLRGLSLRRLGGMLVETVTLSGTITIIIALAGAMSWALTQSGFAQILADTVSTLPGGRASFLAASIATFAALGSVLEGIPALVLFGPLLVPAATAIGVHPVHYAIVVLLSMGLGLFAPPFGYGYYTACAIAKVSPDDAIGSMIPYLLAFALAIILIAAVPWLSVGLL